MRLAFAISLIWAAATIGLEGPDLMFIGNQYMPENKSFSFTYPPIGATRIEATAQHGFVYGIKSLNWNYVSGRCDWKDYSANIAFRSYGIDKLYLSSWYSISARKLFFHKFVLGLGYGRNETNYGDNLFKTSEDYMAIDAGFNLGNLAIAALAGNISLNKNNEISDKPEYLAACSWQADSSLSVNCLLYNDKRNHKRLIVNQNLAVHKSLNIIAGIISAPEIYYAGLEIVYKRFVFGYTFYAVGGLDDCSKLAISYR